jgi:hypothetical protein
MKGVQHSRILNWLTLVRRDLRQTHSRAQKPLFAMVLEPADMPAGHWKSVSDRAFRLSKEGTPEYRRARGNGSVMISRCITDPATESSYVVTLIPFVSEDDARNYLPNAMTNRFGNPFTRNKVISEGSVEVEELSNVRPSVAFEISYDGPDGGPGRQRFVAATVERFSFLATFGRPGGTWSWSEIADVAERQAAKIRSRLTAQ